MCRPPRIPANLEERTARRSLPATFVGCVLPACVISSEQERFWGASLAIELSQSPKSTEIRTSREPRRCLTTVHLDVSLIDGYFDLRR